MRRTIDFLLVTVGTTGFDDLVVATDALADHFEIRDGLVQFGPGEHVPNRLPAERFVPTLDPYYEKASLVIAHGGAGTAFEVLGRGLPLVGVANDDRYDNHQEDLLGALSHAGHAVWCRSLAELPAAVEAALTTDRVPLPSVPCTIGTEIDEHLRHLPHRRVRWPWRSR